MSSVPFEVIIDGNERILALSSQAFGFSYESGIKYLGIWDEMLIELCIIRAKARSLADRKRDGFR
jgi:hypothetical protein